MKSVAELERELLRLPPADRACLALKVWESLANDRETVADPLLDPEGLRLALERDSELDSRSIEAIDDSEFRRRCGVMDED